MGASSGGVYNSWTLLDSSSVDSLIGHYTSCRLS